VIKIKIIPNILSTDGRKTFDVEYVVDRKVSDYLFDVDLKGQKVIYEGRVLSDLSVPLQDNDELIITPDIKAPVIGFLVAAWPIIVATAKIITTIATLASIGYAIYSAVSNKPRKPANGLGSVSGGMEEGSPTYGWDGIRTSMDVGIPVPVVLGSHRVGGNIINQYISTDGNKNYLNVLLALSEGEVEYIDEIEINENPVSNYDGVEIHKRFGTADQTPIPYFMQTHNVIEIGVQISHGLENSYIYTTDKNDVSAFEIYVQLPNGLYTVAGADQHIVAWTATYRVEYKLHTSANWIDLGEQSITERSRSSIRRIFRKEGLVPGQYDIRITKTSYDSEFLQSSDFVIQAIDEIQDNSLAYPNVALLGLRLLATEQLNGPTPNITCVVRRKVLLPKVMNGSQEVDWKDYYWDSESQKYRLLSDNSQLSWDGVSYVNKYCSNPVWIIKDLLLNSRYGLGDFINSDSINLPLLLEMAQYCEEKVPDGNGGFEKRFQLNAVLDSSTRAIDVVMQLSATFRGLPFYSQGSIQLKIDKPELPVQIFGMGNIIENSFKESWISKKEVPNEIEVQFMNESNRFKQESIFIEDEESLYQLNEPRRKKVLRLLVTKLSYAVREGKYALRIAKRLDRMVSFKAGIDAIVCQVGDVVGISHDVPQIGFSGRLKSGTLSSVTLDEPFTVEPGKSYRIIVMFADGNQEEKIISNSPGTYSVLSITENFSQVPQNFDIYAVGEVNKVVEPFRIVSLRRDSKNEVEITAVKYNEAVYDDSGLSLPILNYSSLSADLPNTENLRLSESIFKTGDGTIENKIDVWFQLPTNLSTRYVRTYDRARIYLSDNEGLSWIYKGETVNDHFAIVGDIKDEITYKIAVVSIGNDGQANQIQTSPQVNITVLGKTAPPSNVTGFDVSQEGNFLRFKCDVHPDADFAYFRIKQGSEWSTAQVIIERADLSQYMFPVGQIGRQNLLCKAVDTSGNESLNPAIDTINVTLPPDMNFLNAVNLWQFDNDYILDNLSLVWRNDFSSDYARPVIALRTALTWEDLESEGQTWEYQKLNGGLILNATVESSGYFETNKPIDLGIIFEFKLIIDALYKNVTGGSLVVQISLSEDGTSYSSFVTVTADTIYRARFVKFKVLLSTSDTSQNVYLYDCDIYFNAPSMKVSWGRDVAVPVSGKEILYGQEFTSAPSIKVSIVNGVQGIPIVQNKTTDQFEVKCYNLAGSAIGMAEIDWEAKGY